MGLGPFTASNKHMGSRVSFRLSGAGFVKAVPDSWAVIAARNFNRLLQATHAPPLIMALLSVSLFLSTCIPVRMASLSASSPSSTSSAPCTTSSSLVMFMPLSVHFQRTRAQRAACDVRRSLIVCMAPEEEKMTRRSPLDFPIEWERPKPGRRPDIFPQFSPMKTPLPPPLPADPPEEDEEEEEEKKEEEEENSDTEEPDKPEKQ